MAGIKIEGLNKFYGQTQALFDVTLDVEDGEFAVFVGPSGCGKSTLLRCVAGLEGVETGKIILDGSDVTHAEPADRELSMVFQSYALYPHMTVRANMEFGMKVNGFAPKLQEERIAEAARILQLEDYLERKPGQLSGGQRQRVAIGRAIVKNPKVFLFDEPLSNLDAKLRVQMRVELEALHKQLGATMIYVTHDQVEAMTMADKIVVLQNGLIEQVGSPLELYRTPQNTFVASFIGSPRMNLLDGAEAARHNAHTIGIRPENITISTKKGEWEGVVGVSEHLGSDTYFHVNCPGFTEPLTVRASGAMELTYGSTVYLTPDLAHLHRFDQNGLRLT